MPFLGRMLKTQPSNRKLISRRDVHTTLDPRYICEGYLRRLVSEFLSLSRPLQSEMRALEGDLPKSLFRYGTPKLNLQYSYNSVTTG